eukprot:TRINITY_DN3043_c0_g1_i2.p1 TRINITY_DN3043_c0_g1~~TRINITY_DN3043_c0_g1_i2.p1  ORF type:complete len:143 (-),score=40.27 TRINITY_DN3043_c0_g1_i2:159-587(-)
MCIRDSSRTESNAKLHSYSMLLQNTLGQQRALIAALEKDVAQRQEQKQLDRHSLNERGEQIVSLESSIVQLEEDLAMERSSWEVVVDQVGRADLSEMDSEWREVHECYLDMSKSPDRASRGSPQNSWAEHPKERGEFGSFPN